MNELGLTERQHQFWLWHKCFLDDRQSRREMACCSMFFHANCRRIGSVSRQEGRARQKKAQLLVSQVPLSHTH